MFSKRPWVSTCLASGFVNEKRMNYINLKISTTVPFYIDDILTAFRHICKKQVLKKVTICANLSPHHRPSGVRFLRSSLVS